MDDGFNEVSVTTLSGGAHRCGHNDPFFSFCKAKFAIATWAEPPVNEQRTRRYSSARYLIWQRNAWLRDGTASVSPNKIVYAVNAAEFARQLSAASNEN